MFWIVLFITIVVFMIWKNRKKESVDNKKRDNKNIHKVYESEDGKFIIRGTKEKFEIQKDNGILFTVIDGQIVSVSDKNHEYVYEVK